MVSRILIFLAARGTFLVSKLCLPHLLKAPNPHVLALCPPPLLKPEWFAPNTAYAMAKYGMSLCMLGLAAEFSGRVAFNALWPRTTIATAAIRHLGGEDLMAHSRKPEILADAAYAVFRKDAKSFSGNFLIDDVFLAGEGIKDFDAYRVDPRQSLQQDLFVSGDPPPGLSLSPAH